jgi:hypothetical protein
MSTTTAGYTIEWDDDAELWLVLDAAGEHVGDGETREEAEAEARRLAKEERHEALRCEIEERLWDASLATLERIRALL